MTLPPPPPQSSYNDLIVTQGIFLGLSAFGCCAWNFLIRSGAFWKSDAGHYLRVSLYPIHLALYYSWRPFFLDARISSTLYSGSPSILTGGGGSLTCPGKALSGSLNNNTTGNCQGTRLGLPGTIIYCIVGSGLFTRRKTKRKEEGIRNQTG